MTGKAGVTAMPTPILTRKQTPFDGVPPEVFADLAAFVRRVAPRWVDGSCPRRSNFDPPCRLNFDPGLVAEIA
ncbi:MAG: hypothetical protein HC793_00620 [Aquincola sp.]|nr:hypothetical protein [Aquincola sp.]